MCRFKFKTLENDCPQWGQRNCLLIPHSYLKCSFKLCLLLYFFLHFVQFHVDGLPGNEYKKLFELVKIRENFQQFQQNLRKHFHRIVIQVYWYTAISIYIDILLLVCYNNIKTDIRKKLFFKQKNMSQKVKNISKSQIECMEGGGRGSRVRSAWNKTQYVR